MPFGGRKGPTRKDYYDRVKNTDAVFIAFRREEGSHNKLIFLAAVVFSLLPVFIAFRREEGSHSPSPKSSPKEMQVVFIAFRREEGSHSGFGKSLSLKVGKGVFVVTSLMRTDFEAFFPGISLE